MKNSVLEKVFLNNPQWAVDNQKLLQAVFDNTLDAILMMDEQMCLVDANPAACVLTGYSLAELFNLRIPDITPVAHHGVLATLWQQLLLAGKLESDYRLLCKDGTIIIVEFRAVANIVPGRHFAILHDITARKRAEGSVREAQARTESVLASMGDT